MIIIPQFQLTSKSIDCRSSDIDPMTIEIVFSTYCFDSSLCNFFPEIESWTRETAAKREEKVQWCKGDWLIVSSMLDGVFLLMSSSFSARTNSAHSDTGLCKHTISMGWLCNWTYKNMRCLTPLPDAEKEGRRPCARQTERVEDYSEDGKGEDEKIFLIGKRCEILAPTNWCQNLPQMSNNWWRRRRKRFQVRHLDVSRGF